MQTAAQHVFKHRCRCEQNLRAAPVAHQFTGKGPSHLASIVGLSTASFRHYLANSTSHQQAVPTRSLVKTATPHSLNTVFAESRPS